MRFHAVAAALTQAPASYSCPSVFFTVAPSLCLKLEGRSDGAVDSREKLLEFCFDYCYWSVDPADPHYASQEEVTASPAKH